MIINKRKQTDTNEMNSLRFEPAMKCYPLLQKLLCKSSKSNALPTEPTITRRLLGKFITLDWIGLQDINS